MLEAQSGKLSLHDRFGRAFPENGVHGTPYKTAIVAVPRGRRAGIPRRLRITGRKSLCGMDLPSLPPGRKRASRWHGVCCPKN